MKRDMKKVVLILIMILMAEIVSAQTVILTDFRVDDHPAAYWSGQAVAQASPDGGEFLVGWVFSDGFFTIGVNGSIYSSNGTLIRDDYELDDSALFCSIGYTGGGGSAVDSNGNYYITYMDSSDCFNYDGRVRKFLPNGDPAGASVPVSELGSMATQVIQVARGKNDQVVISFGDAGVIYYRFFNNSLVPLTPSTQGNQTTPAGRPGMATDSIGRYIVAYQPSGPLMGRLFDQDGNPRTDEFNVYFGSAMEIKAIYNKQGNFCVTWWTSTNDAFGRIFDGDGNPLTPVFYLGPAVREPNEWWGRSSLDADDNGNFVIVYSYWSDLTPQGVYGTIYGPDGTLLEEMFPVSQPTGLPFELMIPDVACLDNGRFVTVWRDVRNESDGDIYASILGNNHWSPTSPPPTPINHYYGDANGDTLITGMDVIQVNNYVLSKPYSFDTLQPDTNDQRWNTCDVDSDRVCNGMDVIQMNNYILSKPVSIGARPWVLENNPAAGGLPLAGNNPGEWIPFSIDLYSTHASQGLSGRPGLSVVAEITGGTTTGSLSGRSCDPVAKCGALVRDCPASPGAQCAVSVTITDWVTDTTQGLTESGPFGFGIWADGTGDIDLDIYINADPGLDIPAVTIYQTVGFQ